MRNFCVRKQNGNVLFLILIAVALFAALSYAVTQSTRGGGNADDETALLDSTTVTQFGATITAGIQRMMLFNGVDETELCFYTGNNSATYNHAGCADDDNNIFHPDGGGVSYQSPPNGANDGTEWEFTSIAMVSGQQSNQDADLIVALRGMNQSVCQKINEEVGISGVPSDNGDLNNALFDGTYAATGAFVDRIDGCVPNCPSVGASPVGSIGTPFGCILEDDTGDYIYFHTLLAR